GLSLTGTFLGGSAEDVEEELSRRAARRGTDAATYRRTLRDANAFVGTPEEIARQLAEFTAIGVTAFILWPLDGRHDAAPAVLGAVRRELAG
ncbi:MAG: hypothetical protein HOQ03_12540, partial [Thermoleophilia bacterium]|nr:hypothetical protein [Thermoleophilia bacterium]